MASKAIPLKYFERNLLFLDKGIKAVYVYPMQPLAFQGSTRKKAIMKMLHNFFWVYRGKGKLLLLNKLLTAEELVDELDKIQQDNLFPKTYAKWKNDMYEELEARKPWSQVLYLVLDLPKKKSASKKIDVSSSIEKGGYVQILRDFYSLISSAGLRSIGITSEDIEEEELHRAFSDEESLFNGIRSTGDIKKGTPQDIEFMLKAPFYRALGEVRVSKRTKAPVTTIEKRGNSYIKPNKSYILNLFSEGHVDPDWKHLVINHGGKRDQDKSSYQASLVLTGTPDDINPIDNEWLYWLMTLNFPVDVCINFEIKDPATEIKTVRSKQHDMQGELSTQEENNMKVSDLDTDSMSKGEELEIKLSKGQPLMEMEVILAVAARSKNVLDARVLEIKNKYSPMLFDLSVIPSKAEYCFEKFFPWSNIDEYWKFRCDPGYISSSGIHCTSQLGTETGPWLGQTWTGKPVLADFGWPMRNNMAGTILLIASMGGGKSATKKKIMKTLMLLGAYGFSIDPKDEDHVFMENEELGAYTKVLKFGAGMDSTRLNVFNTSPNFDRAWQVAKSYLNLLLNPYSAERRGLIINKLIRSTMHSSHRHMLGFIEELNKYIKEEQDAKLQEEALMLKDLLESYKEDPLAKIVFHDDSGELELDQYRLVIANVKGLKLPKRGADIQKVDDTTKLSLGVVLLIGHIGRELIQHRPNNILKYFASDEHWIWEGVEEFESLSKELIKMSRSQYVVPIFSTQEAADIKTPDIRNNIGWVFAGKMGSDDEIKDAMDMLGIKEHDEETMMMFNNLKSGTFFVRDPLGRRDLVHIYQPEDWLELFETTPDPKKNIKSA